MNSTTSIKERLATAMVAALALGILLLMYLQARGMMWGFDDYINLNNLTGVSSYAGLIEFLFGGIAGPGGRFLSLLTFVANYDDWPLNPWGFAWVTLCLHICNALLIFLLAQRLLLRETTMAHAAMPVAALAAALWMLLPIQASGILLPVQRMTHVASFFMLLTLYGYVLIRGRQPAVPSLLSMVLLSVWVLAGTALAYFAKENGVTVVTLIALIDLFFFTGTRILQWKEAGPDAWRRRLWTVWIGLATVGITLSLTLLLFVTWDSVQNTYRYVREFTLAERLASQAVISWEYIRQTLIPRAALLGPYHDGHVIYSWDMWQPYLALLAWAGLMLLGWKMYRAGPSVGVRLAGKYLLFSVTWYLACHQVESTFIPLELYFEHRNYLAVLGIVLSLAVLVGYVVLHLPASRNWVMALAGLCVAYQAFVLQQITSLWGNPALANEMWHIHQPTSTRAAQAVINDLMGAHFRDAALKLGNQFVQENQSLDVAIQLAPFHCGPEMEEVDQQAALKRARDLIEHIRRPAGITTGLSALGKAVREQKCQAISLQDYKAFLEALLQNEKVQNYHRVRHHVLYELALVELKLGDVDAYERHAQQAFFDFPAVSMGEVIALELFRAGRAQEAAQWLDTMVEKAPNDLIKDSWSTRLQSLREALHNIIEMEREVADEPDNEQPADKRP